MWRNYDNSKNKTKLDDIIPLVWSKKLILPSSDRTALLWIVIPMSEQVAQNGPAGCIYTSVTSRHKKLWHKKCTPYSRSHEQTNLKAVIFQVHCWSSSQWLRFFPNKDLYKVYNIILTPTYKQTLPIAQVCHWKQNF